MGTRTPPIAPPAGPSIIGDWNAGSGSPHAFARAAARMREPRTVTVHANRCVSRPALSGTPPLKLVRIVGAAVSRRCFLTAVPTKLLRCEVGILMVTCCCRASALHAWCGIAGVPKKRFCRDGRPDRAGLGRRSRIEPCSCHRYPAIWGAISCMAGQIAEFGRAVAAVEWVVSGSVSDR